MRCILTFVKCAFSCLLLLILVGCGEKGIIGKKTMVAVTKDIYLADQFIEQNPDMRAQADSLTVYPAILAKYGYTPDDYSRSVGYYLQKGESYSRILKEAQRQLEERVEILDREIARLRILEAGPTRWWALDSVRNIATQELVYDPVLRGVRWLVIPGEKLERWKFNDSAVVDIPENPIWWNNNIQVPLEREHFTYYRKK